MPHTHHALSNNQRRENDVLTNNKPAKRSELKAIQADIKLDKLYAQLEQEHD